MTARDREVTLEAKSRTFSIVPCGTDTSPAGLALGPEEPPRPLKLDRPLVGATVASSEILRLESLLWLLESHPVPRLINR
jgi:hypothetical protein